MPTNKFPHATLVLSDTTSPTLNANEAVWLSVPGEGETIKVYPQSPLNWSDPMSALNAVSDWAFNEKYNTSQSKLGLHLFAGKTLDDRFGGHVGYVHVTYKSADFAPITLEDFPHGWAAVNMRNGVLSVDTIKDMRTPEEKSREDAERGRFQPTDAVASRKHDWIDALISGRPLLIRVAGIRPYVADRLEQWALGTTTERLQDRRQHIVTRNLWVNRTAPKLREVYRQLQAEGVDPKAEVQAPTIEGEEPVETRELLFPIHKGEGSVNMFEFPAFFPTIWNKRGGLESTGYAWNPRNPVVIRYFENCVKDGCTIGSLPELVK